MFVGLVVGPVTVLAAGLAGVLTIGLIVGQLWGGFTFIQHFMLRFILWRNDDIPCNYVRFLDYAADHIFLRKVVGGYIFIHRMLLEYFASLETEPSTQDDK